MRFLSAAATNGAMEIQQVVNVAVVVAGVYLIGEGKLSMGGLIACTMLTSRAVAPTRTNGWPADAVSQRQSCSGFA